MSLAFVWVAAALAAVGLGRVLYARLLLSRAKHPSLLGHARLAKRLARLMPAYRYDEERFFASDGAPEPIAARRRQGFSRLSRVLADSAPATIDATERLQDSLSDLQFTKRYRVPFQYRDLVGE